MTKNQLTGLYSVCYNESVDNTEHHKEGKQ
nr:MAG TPA: hypothetical protein [Caudoviricetes sp.]